MIAGRSPWLCQGTIPPGSMVSLRKRSWRSLIIAGSFSRSMAASTVSVTPLAACDTASRALVLTWSAGHWPAAADDRPAANEPITTPARAIVRPMVRPLMLRLDMFLSSVDGSAGLTAAPVLKIHRSAPQWKCHLALESIAGCYAKKGVLLRYTRQDRRDHGRCHLELCIAVLDPVALGNPGEIRVRRPDLALIVLKHE